MLLYILCFGCISFCIAHPLYEKSELFEVNCTKLRNCEDNLDVMDITAIFLPEDTSEKWFAACFNGSDSLLTLSKPSEFFKELTLCRENNFGRGSSRLTPCKSRCYNEADHFSVQQFFKSNVGKEKFKLCMKLCNKMDQGDDLNMDSTTLILKLASQSPTTNHSIETSMPNRSPDSSKNQVTSKAAKILSSTELLKDNLNVELSTNEVSTKQSTPQVDSELETVKLSSELLVLHTTSSKSKSSLNASTTLTHLIPSTPATPIETHTFEPTTESLKFNQTFQLSTTQPTLKVLKSEEPAERSTPEQITEPSTSEEHQRSPVEVSAKLATIHDTFMELSIPNRPISKPTSTELLPPQLQSTWKSQICFESCWSTYGLRSESHFNSQNVCKMSFVNCYQNCSQHGEYPSDPYKYLEYALKSINNLKMSLKCSECFRREMNGYNAAHFYCSDVREFANSKCRHICKHYQSSQENRIGISFDSDDEIS